MEAMSPRLKQSAMIGMFILLAGLAAWGWMRKPANPYTTNASAPATAEPPITAQPMNGQSLTYDSYGQAVAANPTPANNDASQPYSSTTANPCATTVSDNPAPAPLYASRDYVRTVRPANNYAPQRPTPTRYVERGSA